METVLSLAPYTIAAGAAVLAAMLWPRGEGVLADRRRLSLADRARRRREALQREAGRLGAARRKADDAGLRHVSGLAVVAAQVVAGALVGAAAWGYTGNPAAGFIMALGGAQVPALALEMLAAPRRRAFESQVEGLLLAASPALEVSGEPLVVILKRMAADAPEPMRGELLRVLGEAEGGKPLGAALEEWAGRRNNRTLRALAFAVELHDRHGGDLPKTVGYLANRVRRQARIRAQHKAESAGERIALFVASLIPTGTYLLFAPRMPALETYLRHTAGGAFGVAFLAGVQVGAILLLRLYVLLPEILG